MLLSFHAGPARAATVRAVGCPSEGWCCQAEMDELNAQAADRVIGFAAGRCNETGFNVSEGSPVPVLVGGEGGAGVVRLALALFRAESSTGGGLPAAEGME